MHLYPKRAPLNGLELEIFKLVSYSATPEQWAEWPRASLEHAAARGNVDLVDALLGAGAGGGAGWRGCRGRTLLHAAALGGSAKVMFALLRAGAQPDVNVVALGSKRSALYVATVCGHTEAARCLLVAGADVDFEDPVDQRTVLHAAARGGHEQLVNDLLIGGADPNVSNMNDGRTPLHIAARHGHAGIVSSLVLRGADKDAVDLSNGDSALMCAADLGHLAAVETLLAAGADDAIRIRSSSTAFGLSALDGACIEGHIPVIKALVRRGANVNACDDEGYGALHHAARNGQEGAIHALIEAGANVDLRADDGVRPLIDAAAFRLDNAIRALLRYGARIDVQDEDGVTPLHAACSGNGPGAAVVVDLLLRWGADETAVNIEGRTPISFLDENSFLDDDTCPSNEFDRVCVLLYYAPADRNWRRRCWVVMLRSRAARQKVGFERSSGGSEKLDVHSIDAANVDQGEAGKLTNTVGSDSTDPVILGHAGSASSRAGDCSEGGWCRGLVMQLVGLDLEGVFRNAVGYL